MGEVAALVGRTLRESLRRPAARRAVLLALALLVAVLLGLGHGARGASTVVAAALLVVGATAFGAAAAAGGLLPRDRESGRAAWLATLAPPAAAHRIAAALSGGALALLLAVLGAALVGLAVPRLVEGVGVRQTQAIGVGATRRLPPEERRSPPWRLPLPAAAPGSTVEVAFAAPYVLADAPLVTPRVAWRVGAAAGEAALAYGRPLQVPLPTGTQTADDVLEVRNLTPATWLFVREARLLGRETPFLLSLLLAGLLLGVAAAALAPAAVLVSRFTSGPTATLAALVLGLAGVLAPFLARPAAATAGWTEAWGATILGLAARAAPDFSGLYVLGEPGAGHALGGAALAPFVPPILYGLLALALVALPLPRPWQRKEAP